MICLFSEEEMILIIIERKNIYLKLLYNVLLGK